MDTSWSVPLCDIIELMYMYILDKDKVFLFSWQHKFETNNVIIIIIK